MVSLVVWLCFLASPILTLLAFVAAAVGVVFFVRNVNRKRRQQNQIDDLDIESPVDSRVLRRISTTDIAGLEWLSFENLCLIWLRSLGCEAARTAKGFGTGADGGIDIVGTTRAGQPFCAQCKAHSGLIGVKFVREFFGAFASSNQRGVFFSATGFTDDARRFAAKEGVVLISNSDMFDVLNQPQTLALARITIFNGGETTPACPHCEQKMVLRKGQNTFWGCVNFPRCRQTLSVRRAAPPPVERCRVPGDWLEAPGPTLDPAPIPPGGREPDESRFAPPDADPQEPKQPRGGDGESSLSATPPIVLQAGRNQLFCLKDGAPVPVTKEQLSALLQNKEIAGHSYVCFGGDRQWRQLFSMPGLFSVKA